MTIIERARILVAQRPSAIEGQSGNATTFSVASVLVWGFGLTPDEALPVIMEYNARCEPLWAQRDLERMLRNAEMKGGDKPRGHLVGEGKHERGSMATAPEEPQRKRKRELMLDALKAAQDPELAMDTGRWKEWLRLRSICDPRTVSPEMYLDSLYRPGEKVLIFNKMWGSQGDYGRHIGKSTWKLGKFKGDRAERIERLPPGSLEGMTFLMQPVDAEWHLKSGTNELSRRTKASVTRWPYLLLESDKAPLDMWLNVMVRARIRIVSITASGGRSLHAVVRIDKESEDELNAELASADAKETLAVLGCDAQALHGMVYPRLPNTMREGKQMAKLDNAGKPIKGPNGRTVMHFVPFRDGPARQSLIYFNPYAEVEKSIAEIPAMEVAD
jgi:hypothetical protein